MQISQVGRRITERYTNESLIQEYAHVLWDTRCLSRRIDEAGETSVVTNLRVTYDDIKPVQCVQEYRLPESWRRFRAWIVFGALQEQQVGVRSAYFPAYHRFLAPRSPSVR